VVIEGKTRKMSLELHDAGPDFEAAALAERAYLKEALLSHPEWLREDADLLSGLGLRLDAANIVDFGPVALSRVSAAHRRESSARQHLETMARANFAAQTQTHAAVVDVLDAAALEDIARRVDELARLRFGLAIGVLALEDGDTPDGWVTLAQGQTDLLLGDNRLARLGRLPTAAGLFGPMAPEIESVALARLTLWRPARQGVMAFGSTDPDAFTPDMGPDLITFLARVVERTAERWPRR
jgi:uncharacterized protein YigA (DUF484 family)